MPSSFLLTLAEAAAPLTGGAPQSADPQLLDLDGTLFVQLGIFLVAMAALSKLLWKPYLRIRAERSTRVEGYKADAKRMDADAIARLQKIDAELAEVRRQGSGERSKARAAALVTEQELVSRAQADAQKALTEARAKLDLALTNERATLAAHADTLGRQAAERILGRKVA